MSFYKYIFLINKIKEYQKDKKPLFIFVPTINECDYLFSILAKFVKGGNHVKAKLNISDIDKDKTAAMDVDPKDIHTN